MLKTGKNHDKPAHVAARKDYFDWLAGHIQIPGLMGVTRATDFDDSSYRNGGISVLNYPSGHPAATGRQGRHPVGSRVRPYRTQCATNHQPLGDGCCA